MSMLDALFNKGGFFKAARCKTLLKLTAPRIKLLRNRREVQIRQMRKDIAKLLETGQEATAKIRVEHIIREENLMAAQEIIELFCELIVVRLPIIESQRECPLDLKEAISSICFAAPRCSDLPELQQIQMQFAGKYGKEFITAATELLPSCGVNREIIELLSIRTPSVEVKMKLLKEIAEEHEIDWDPDSMQAEFLKPHEDLLNGPGHLTGGYAMPLPKEKCDDSMSSTSDATRKDHEPEVESDTGFDSLEVPKVSSHLSHFNPPATNTMSTHTVPVSEASPIMSAPPPSVRTSDVEPHPDSLLESSLVTPLQSDSSTSTPPSVAVDVKENKQFVPFVSPPPPPAAVSTRMIRGSQASFAEPPSSSLSQAECEKKLDLDDVLVAAQTAAETAERAAVAARAAANLAQVRISELATKTSDQASHNGSRAPKGSSNKTDGLSFSSPEKVCEESGSPRSSDNEFAHRPSRSTSLEDDPYSTYPDLFGRQN